MEGLSGLLLFMCVCKKWQLAVCRRLSLSPFSHVSLMKSFGREVGGGNGGAKRGECGGIKQKAGGD